MLRATTGLNNVVDPARLSYNEDNGVCELAEAVNVDIDRTGRVGRRKGYSEIGNFTNVHSLYASSAYMYFISEGILYAMNQSEGTTALGSISDERTAFETVGSRTYFSNNMDSGIIDGLSRSPWTAASYVGPATDRTFSDPPKGNHLRLFNSRMLIGSGDLIWASERFSYHWFDMARSYMPVGSEIRMIDKVSSGFYVGVDGRILYYHGNDFDSVAMTVISDETIITGTNQMIQGSNFPDYRIHEQMIIAATNRGIILLGPGGFYKNLTDDKLTYDASKLGGSVLTDKKYIFSCEP